jgi:vacuolar protein sorting-associated protein 13A/C
MAKKLLLNVLSDAIGEYVDGLSRENLKMGIWAGNLEVSGLTLKASALSKLDLPLAVTKGKHPPHQNDMF